MRVHPEPPCTDRDTRRLTDKRTHTRGTSARAADAKRSASARLHTNMLAVQACAQRGCKTRAAPAPAAHQRLLGLQRGALRGCSLGRRPHLRAPCEAVAYAAASG